MSAFIFLFFSSVFMSYVWFFFFFFLFKQKTAYEMRISDWSSDVCSSDLRDHVGGEGDGFGVKIAARERLVRIGEDQRIVRHAIGLDRQRRAGLAQQIEHGAHHLRLTAEAIGILHAQIGKASCREGVCQYVSISVVAVSLKKKITQTNQQK